MTADTRRRDALRRWLRQTPPGMAMTIADIAAASGLYDEGAASVNVTRCAGDVWDLADSGVLRRVAQAPEMWLHAAAPGAHDGTQRTTTATPGAVSRGSTGEEAVMKTYAGVGSRLTPPPMLALCERVARALAADGWTLRSGHAQGADMAFERGAGGAAEIFLPWPTFRCDDAVRGRRFAEPEPAAYAIAETHHPNWGALRRPGRSLHARNCHQLLGWTLANPAQFVLCWTPNATVDGTGRGSGGTGQVLRLAAALRVPVFNLARGEHRDRICRWLGCQPPPDDDTQLTIGEAQHAHHQ